MLSKLWSDLDGGGGAGEDLRDLHLMDYALNQLISVCFVAICPECACGILKIEYLRCFRKYTEIFQHHIFPRSFERILEAAVNTKLLIFSCVRYKDWHPPKSLLHFPRIPKIPLLAF